MRSVVEGYPRPILPRAGRISGPYPTTTLRVVPLPVPERSPAAPGRSRPPAASMPRGSASSRARRSRPISRSTCTATRSIRRPADAADRGARRGAIRAKVLDWLAAGPHGADVAAVRPAHRRHGGAGALYLVLKRRR